MPADAPNSCWADLGIVFNKLLRSPKGGEVADMGVVGVNDTEFNISAKEAVQTDHK